ncbi:FeoA family protein [Tepidimonas sp.]|uniref:FeoA family protein n=1 Tax=Tepidimonas sp. TaxID=2002775 RepID=UPI002FDF3194
MRLTELPLHRKGCITRLHTVGNEDGVAQRLQDLGFVPGETVEVVAYAPFAREPLVVQVARTRFALRRAEAQRVEIEAV